MHQIKSIKSIKSWIKSIKSWIKSIKWESNQKSNESNQSNHQWDENLMSIKSWIKWIWNKNQTNQMNQIINQMKIKSSKWFDLAKNRRHACSCAINTNPRARPAWLFPANKQLKQAKLKLQHHSFKRDLQIVFLSLCSLTSLWMDKWMDRDRWMDEWI